MSIRLLCCSGSLDGGGSERQLWQLALGVDPEIFHPNIYVHYRRGLYLGLTPQRVPVYDYWSHQRFRPFRFPGQIHHHQVKHLQQVIRQQQIDLVYDRTFHMTLVTAPACRRSAIPRVSVIVSPPSQDFLRSRERFAWLKKRMLARAYRDPTCTTLAVSASVAEDAARFFGLTRAKIEVIPSPIDSESILSQATSPLITVPPASFRVCVVGRLSLEKGQRHALQAFATAIRNARQDDWVLDVVGDGPERQNLEALSTSLGIREQTRFHGFQNNPYPFMKAADLLLIPSEYEGLPNVALEAMALRTAVVATQCSDSLTELLGANERGVSVPVGDVNQLALAIADRISHSDAWQRRIDLAEQEVLQRHRLQPWMQQMEQMFLQKVAAGRSPTR